MRLELNDQKYRIIKIHFLDFNDDNGKKAAKTVEKPYKAEVNRCYRLNWAKKWPRRIKDEEKQDEQRKPSLKYNLSKFL